FDEIDLGDQVNARAGEAELADQLISQLSAKSFEPQKYKDAYRDRVHAAVEQKIAGQEVHVAHEQPTAQIIDLFEALKASLGQSGKAPRGEAAPAKEGTKKTDLKGPKPPKKALPRSAVGGKKKTSSAS